MKKEYRRVYVVANSDGIPFHAQPEDGYTLREAISRVCREVEENNRLGFEDHESNYIIYDTSANTWKSVKFW